MNFRLIKIATLLQLALTFFSFSEDIKIENAKIYTDNAAAYTSKYDMIEKATKTIDMSYFIIEDDYSSSLFFKKILQKIQKSKEDTVVDGKTVKGTPIKVRILVDYFMTDLQIPFLRFLDAYPEIEVRRYGAPSEKWKKVLTKLKINGPLFVESLMAQNSANLKESLKDAPAVFQAKVDPQDLEKNKNPDAWIMQVQNAVDALKEPGTATALKKDVTEFYEGFLDFMHRTHHKLLIVDGKYFQMGGRNISDEYHAGTQDALITQNKEDPFWKEFQELNFDIKPREYAFADIDVAATLTAGGESNPVVKSFERLWGDKNKPTGRNVAVSYTYTAHEQVNTISTVNELTNKAKAGNHLRAYTNAAVSINGTNLSASYLENGAITEEYIKILDSLQKGDTALFVNAYFYLDPEWVSKDGEALTRLYNAFINAGNREANITIKTNSIATTDLNVVNVFSYEKYPALIAAGIKLEELQDFPDKAQHQGSLHMKSAFIASAKGNCLIVGSYNLDPRSHLRDTNNALKIEVANDQVLTQFAAYEAGINKLKWVKVDDAQLAKIKAIAAAQKSQDTRRNIGAFKAEL